jgi:adenylylsulfate kinase-like enzyme
MPLSSASTSAWFLRNGYVASEITKNGGVAICAPIAPYDAVRKNVRAMTQLEGGFLLVHVAIPIEVCEERDRKSKVGNHQGIHQDL